MSPFYQSPPAMAARKMGCSLAKAISEFAPDNPFGIIHHVYSLHELKHTQEAWNVLLPAVDKFPKDTSSATTWPVMRVSLET